MVDVSKLQDIYRKYSADTMPKPRIIHVETRTRCNGTCSFCAASIDNDTRDDIHMPDALIDKLIKNLADWDYNNRLSFYNNNEPFLEKRIYDIIKKARVALPKTYLELKTNGKTLTIEKIFDIFDAGLDMLYINDYSETGEFRDNIKKIIDDLKGIRRFKGHFESPKDIYLNRISIKLRNVNAVMTTRGGSSPNKKFDGNNYTAPCFRPFEMMTIHPEGNVSVCSADVFQTFQMGNANDQTLSAIWKSEGYQKYRAVLLEGERSCKDICSKCDYSGVSQEMRKENELLEQELPRYHPKRIARKLYKIFGIARN